MVTTLSSPERGSWLLNPQPECGFVDRAGRCESVAEARALTIEGRERRFGSPQAPAEKPFHSVRLRP